MQDPPDSMGIAEPEENGWSDTTDSPVVDISAIVGGAMEMLTSAKDKDPTKTLVAVTDRRIVTAKTNAFLDRAEIRQDMPIDQVRYVRATTTQDKSPRSATDLITRDENTRWVFHTDIDKTQVNALAAVLAESMTIPDAERDELRQHRYPSIEADAPCAPPPTAASTSPAPSCASSRSSPA